VSVTFTTGAARQKVALAKAASKAGHGMSGSIEGGCEAAVFAGGAGRRIGGDKPLLDLAGRPLVAWVVEALAGRASRVLLVAKSRSQASALAEAIGPSLSPAAGAILTPCADRPGLEGPVAALMGAADAAGAPYLLTSPADTPFLPADLPYRLAAAADHDTAAIVAEAEGWHPTVALYDARRLRDCRPGRSLRETIAPLSPRTAALDPLMLFNVNTRADLDAARALAEALTDGAKRP